MSDIDVAELMERVSKFERMELPGQPMGMHMGTMYLVGDLKRALSGLQKKAEADRRELDDLRSFLRGVATQLQARAADVTP